LLAFLVVDDVLIVDQDSDRLEALGPPSEVVGHLADGRRA
jgi:hypothetical protein